MLVLNCRISLIACFSFIFNSSNTPSLHSFETSYQTHSDTNLSLLYTPSLSFPLKFFFSLPWSLFHLFRSFATAPLLCLDISIRMCVKHSNEIHCQFSVVRFIHWSFRSSSVLSWLKLLPGLAFLIWNGDIPRDRHTDPPLPRFWITLSKWSGGLNSSRKKFLWKIFYTLKKNFLHRKKFFDQKIFFQRIFFFETILRKKKIFDKIFFFFLDLENFSKIFFEIFFFRKSSMLVSNNIVFDILRQFC